LNRYRTTWASIKSSRFPRNRSFAKNSAGTFSSEVSARYAPGTVTAAKKGALFVEGSVKNTLIILAGGKSRRFQRDKTLVKLGSSGLLIESIVNRCRSIFDEILIMSNEKNKFGIEGTDEYSDLFPGLGPIGGIHGGLHFMKGNTALVTACDMPFFDSVLAEKLLSLSDGFDVVIPWDGDNFQPLFAVYKKTMLSVFETYILKGTFRPLEVIQDAHTRYVDKEEWVVMEENKGRDIFYNINYQKDYFAITGGTYG
jgi:molybdopterin-guanine dinucleotide biosynthesis protein A